MNTLAITKNLDTQNQLEVFSKRANFGFLQFLPDTDLVAAIKKSSIELIVADFNHDAINGYELINLLLSSDLDQYPYILFIIEPEQKLAVVDSLGPIAGDFLCLPYDAQSLEARFMVILRVILQNKQLKIKSERAESLMMYDEKTGVLNKQASYERALAEVNRAQRNRKSLGLAVLEIADITSLEKLYGLETINQAMRYVARAAKANIRIYDIVGRWVGQKFLVLLPDVEQGITKKIFERIQKAVSSVQVKLSSGELLHIEVCIGFICSDPQDPKALYVLIEKANQALQAALASPEQPVVEYSL